MNFLVKVAILFVFVTGVRSYCSEDNHLVTLTKSELIEIVNCISRSHNQTACDRLAFCNNYKPKEVKEASDQCKAKYNPSGKRRCNANEQLYKSEEIGKIFDCIAENSSSLKVADGLKLVEFETCIRVLYIEACTTPNQSMLTTFQQNINNLQKLVSF